jgi:2-C-methyl-D-erythritol 2,4-cyclodiphosphate synthase/2-C-methyl-D-erythritol 4-phosphate cytidylyltransferase
MKVSLILACAGKGERAGFDKNKLLVKFQGDKTALEITLSKFINSGKIDEYVITASAQDFDAVKSLVPTYCKVVLGGATRTESVISALNEVSGDIVLIHDGARPFVTDKMISDCIETANKEGGCIPVVPTKDTMVKVDNDTPTYLGKSGIYSVQTPQGFNVNHLKNAYAHAGAHAYNDDGEVYKNYTGTLATYAGDVDNVKLTFREDFKKENPEYRFGVGFDCHKLVENRKLILGGITIPHDKGLLGHSDADVLTHAIMDAILSASANRDIGYHFSDKDPAYKDADSMKLLERVIKMTFDLGYKVDGISASIMAEKPKLLKIIPSITENLATALNLPLDKVGISATTLEGLGFVGREEGICVYATATLVKI